MSTATATATANVATRSHDDLEIVSSSSRHLRHVDVQSPSSQLLPSSSELSSSPPQRQQQQQQQREQGQRTMNNRFATTALLNSPKSAATREVSSELRSVSSSSSSLSQLLNPSEVDVEKLEVLKDACEQILSTIGEDVNRDGLRKTPERYAKAMLFLTKGYSQDPTDVLNEAVFEDDADELVVVKDIQFFSMCEHHMLPFYGKVTVGYLPNGKILGLSKMARFVEVFARRLQVQERLTRQVAETMMEVLDARGVAVRIEASHMCMTMRGVEKPGASTVTMYTTGTLRTDKELRREFLNLAGVTSSSSY